MISNHKQMAVVFGYPQNRARETGDDSEMSQNKENADVEST